MIPNELRFVVPSRKRGRSYVLTSALDRFWRHVQVTDGCWLWTGCDRRGYGIFFPRHGKTMLATRFSYELHSRVEIPAGMNVCHHCDIPACVRPDHLFLGTQADNLRDMDRKGRRRASEQAGEANGNARLTLSDVALMRHLYTAERRTVRELGEFFGVCFGHAGRIVNGQKWRTLTETT